MMYGIINAIILLIISAIHLYWVAGGRQGLNAAVPHHNGSALFRPGIVATLAVAILLACAALFYLVKVAVLTIDLPPVIDRFGAWFLGVVFLFRAIGDFRYVGFFKKIKDSQFADLDSKFYSPLCVLLALNSFLIAIYY